MNPVARIQVEAQRRQLADRMLAQLRETLPSVLAEYPVDAAYVYGSVARGTVTPLSDAAIALVLSEPFSPYDRLRSARTRALFTPVSHYGYIRPNNRGKGIVSRMWCMPHIQATVRSTPRPNPE